MERDSATPNIYHETTTEAKKEQVKVIYTEEEPVMTCVLWYIQSDQ